MQLLSFSEGSLARQGALMGVGLSIGYPMALNGWSTGVVISANLVGPEENARILPGDIILAIDNKSSENMDIWCSRTFTVRPITTFSMWSG
jgi:C-terminal processing protease CtpA/Prc